MNLNSYGEKGLHVNDCVSVSVSDYGGGSSSYEGMIIKASEQLVVVLFTDGDVCKYNTASNNLRLLSPRESLVVSETILKVLENMEALDNKIEAQKAKVNGALSRLLR
ncbi:MAG: hypothetical protein WCO66_02550 [Candidatus Absconditabacteria bacterium]